MVSMTEHTLTAADLPPLRVLVVEDHPIVTHGLESLLGAEPDLKVVATCSTAAAAVDLAANHDVDVVVLPWRLEGRAVGRELIRSLRAVTAARLVIYTGFVLGVEVPAEQIAGVTVVPRTASPTELLAVVRHSAESPTAPAQLTPRERQIHQMLLQGLSNAEIGELLTVELSTVKTHVRSVLRKLGVTSRRDLIGRATRHQSH